MRMIHVIYTYTFHIMTFLVPLVTHEAICLCCKGYMERTSDFFFLQLTQPSKQVKGRMYHYWMAACTSAVSCSILQLPWPPSLAAAMVRCGMRLLGALRGQMSHSKNRWCSPSLELQEASCAPATALGGWDAQPGPRGWVWGQKYGSRDLA